MRLVELAAGFAITSFALADARADCDVSTDAAIDAAYKKATGHALSREHRCARRSETFPDLVWIGSFAHDRGCRREGILARCKLDPPGYAAAAMKQAGWPSGDAAKRKALAIAWLREIDDERVLERAPDNFGTKQFTAPALTARDKASVVEAWVQEPAGMQPESDYTKIRVEFAADGTHGKIETIDSQSVPIR
jgi:hypothetical protein